MAKKKKKLKFNKLIALLVVLSSFYIIYNIILLGPIEPLIRYILIGIILIVDIIIFLKAFKSKNNHISLALLMILIIVINILLGSSINLIYNMLSNMTSNKTLYSTSLVALKKSKIKSIDSIKKKKICLINDTTSNDGYIIPKSMIEKYNLEKNNSIVDYDDYSNLLHALYSEECDLIFLPANFTNMFSNIEEYHNIAEEVSIIKTQTKKAQKTSKTYGTKKITEPFTMLLIGIDSSRDGLENSDSFNGDSLMLVTFNPDTFNATILSIPRDSYVPIACFKNQYENKITHAAWKGTDCVINTITNFTGIKIDYYAKINFKGLTSLVDALGGITVDVPKDLCTDNSNRQGQVCIKKGRQKLNGEEALVLARNRKQLANGDIDRGLNQQVVLQGILNSATNIKSANDLLKLLDVISKNMDTNMSTETILSFYNVGKTLLLNSKDTSKVIDLQQLYLAGVGQTIYDENTRLNLWNYILNKQSVKDVTDEMKINLGIQKPKQIKKFSYSINEPYKKQIIGKGPYKVYTTYDLVPDLTKYTKQQAIEWSNKYNITLEITEVAKSGKYKNGQIISQEYPFRKRIDKIPNKTMKITVVSKNETSKTFSDKIDCTDKENLNNKSCLIPDFTQMTRNEVNAWKSKFTNSIVITYIKQNGSKDKIIKQSVKKGTHINDLKSNNITLTVTEKS